MNQVWLGQPCCRITPFQTYTHCLCLRFGPEKLTWRSPTVVEENWDKVALALFFFSPFFGRKKQYNVQPLGPVYPVYLIRPHGLLEKGGAHYKNLGWGHSKGRACFPTLLFRGHVSFPGLFKQLNLREDGVKIATRHAHKWLPTWGQRQLLPVRSGIQSETFPSEAFRRKVKLGPSRWFQTIFPHFCLKDVIDLVYNILYVWQIANGS